MRVKTDRPKINTEELLEIAHNGVVFKIESLVKLLWPDDYRDILHRIERGTAKYHSEIHFLNGVFGVGIGVLSSEHIIYVIDIEDPYTRHTVNPKDNVIIIYLKKDKDLLYYNDKYAKK